MTGLGPSLRRLPSGDPKPGPGATGGASDGKPDGSSDAGDSLDGQTSGMTLARPLLSLLPLLLLLLSVLPLLLLLLSVSLFLMRFWLLYLSWTACLMFPTYQHLSQGPNVIAVHAVVCAVL